MNKIFKGAFFAAALVLLAGCDLQSMMCQSQTDCATSSPPVDSPGSFSIFAVEDFTNPNDYPMCSGYSNTSTYAQCFYDLQSNFGAQMQNNGWSGSTTIDGILNSNWTSAIQESSVQNTTSTLEYLFSHAGVINGSAQVCLRNCDGSTVGSTYSVSASSLPSGWGGPTWLVIDACSAVLQNVGWEHTFGGNLHGILGFNQDNHGLTDGGQETFARLIKGYDNVVDAWDQATAQTSASTYASALIPAANANDAIEARGGPHFGYDRDTSPQYYQRNNDGKLATQAVQKFASPPAYTYSLIPEYMNESYWESYYGGNSVPSVTSYPNANEHMYRNPNVYVDHYVASGGLVVGTKSTGTAKGFSETAAYQYALQWLQNNGGLPSDAALTFAGPETVTPISQQPTSDQPYPNVRQYIFVWRHATSGILDGDKIEIHVDDAGDLTTYTQRTLVYDPDCKCRYYVTNSWQDVPWVPVYHVHIYVRSWRTLGGAQAQYQAQSLGGSSAYGYCASDMASPSSVATPCGVQAASSGTRMINLMSGAAFATSETH